MAAFADGWYGFNLAPEAVAERIGTLAENCQRRGRSLQELTVAVSLTDSDPALLPELASSGVTELVIVAAPPGDPAAATAWVAELAARWISPAG